MIRSLIKAAAMALVSAAGCIAMTVSTSAEAAGISDADVSVKWQSYTYTGRNIRPDDRNGSDEVTVSLDGVLLTKGKDYNITYFNNHDVGVAKMMIIGTGRDYSGFTTKDFIIKPEQNEITSITSDRKSGGRFSITWNKGTEGTVGYQVLYSMNETALKKASNAVGNSDPKKQVYSWIQDDVSDTSENFSRIPSAGQKWYVKIRSFYTADGKTSSTKYGNYSAVKSIYIPANTTEDPLLLYCPYITQYKTAKNSSGIYPYNSEGFDAPKGCGPTSLAMMLQGEEGRTDLTKTKLVTAMYSHGWFYGGWANAPVSMVYRSGCEISDLISLADYFGYHLNADYSVSASVKNGVTTIPDIDKRLASGHLVLVGQAGCSGGTVASQHFMVIYGRRYDSERKENIYLIANPAHIDHDSGDIQTNLAWGAKLLVKNMNYAVKYSVRGILWLD